MVRLILTCWTKAYLQVQKCVCGGGGGFRVCRDDRGDAGLKSVSNERVSQDMDVSRLQRTSIWAEGRR